MYVFSVFLFELILNNLLAFTLVIDFLFVYLPINKKKFSYLLNILLILHF